MNYILLSSGLAFLITFFAIPVIIQVAKDKKLFDEVQTVFDRRRLKRTTKTNNKSCASKER